MHFFNPVPLMKLVEVVSGPATGSDVAAAIFELSKRWGKTPVHARSTPGFIVNRIARPYYAEALALLHERLAEPATIDACLRGAGFRMGPCELMDLIGHDTNFAVTQSVYDANFGDKRYLPSLVQREMVDGGLLGRKSGRGFFSYGRAARRRRRLRWRPWMCRRCRPVIVALHGRGIAVDRWAARLEEAEVRFEAVRRAAGAACRPTPASCASPRPRCDASRRRVRRSRSRVFDLAVAPPAARPGRRSRCRSRRVRPPHGGAGV